MNNRDKNVKNELAYFYAVIKNMDKKDFIKQSNINKHEISLDEFLYDQFSITEDMDKHLEEQNLLNWIESIENPKLYEAVKNLSIDDQAFLSYMVKEGLTQRELAQIYRIAQKNVNKRFRRIIKTIKCFLK
ncbi:hypothetical protein [Helicobacter typhlonius]|uniref:hypothetical protein n=1 Tax=Helicobacter typhlonius TaxID=76936 RepID=UPI002FE16603